MNNPNTRGPATPRQFWRSQGAEGREMPRAKREKVFRYYSKVISGTLSALDNGQGSKFPGRTYIEFVLSALGFSVPDWTHIGDDELIRLNACHLRQTDDAGHEAELRRLKKQRERTNDWQGEAGNPILIEHRVSYDRDEQRNYSEYRVPFGELIRDIIADAPIGTNDAHLKPAIKRHVRAYLERFDGTAKPVHKTRHPSAISDAHRSATLARKAFENEARKSGRTSAANLVLSSLRAEFGDDFGEIFRQTPDSDELQQTQDLDSNSVCDKCHQPIRPQRPINPTTYEKKESAENFDEKDGLKRGVL